MVNQTTRYAMHILSYLAQHEGELVPGETVAREIGVPANYLSKILNQLRKSGFVEARKGWGGGFRVKRTSLKRSLEDLVHVFEGEERTSMPSCIFGLPECDADNPCPLHDRWAAIRDSFSQMLRTTTVGDLKSQACDTAGSGKTGTDETRRS